MSSLRTEPAVAPHPAGRHAVRVSSFGLVLDCADPDALAEFWSAALGYESPGSAGNYAVLVCPTPGRPKLLLQGVPEPKTTKNRMHIDIETPDIEPEAARLEKLGATRLRAETQAEHGSTWILMADPEGNEFCVCDAGQSGS
jgi:predicted enzyme related to lactoylglutathione lyase